MLTQKLWILHSQNAKKCFFKILKCSMTQDEHGLKKCSPLTLNLECMFNVKYCPRTQHNYLVEVQTHDTRITTHSYELLGHCIFSCNSYYSSAHFTACLSM